MSNESLITELSVSYDPTTETYRATADATAIDPSIAIIQMMAHICETDPTQLDPLYEAIDPDVLDQISTETVYGHRANDRYVQFTYLDHRVTVKSYGLIEVEPLSGADGDETN